MSISIRPRSSSILGYAEGLLLRLIQLFQQVVEIGQIHLCSADVSGRHTCLIARHTAGGPVGAGATNGRGDWRADRANYEEQLAACSVP